MKHNWEYKQLGDICKIYQPKTISSSDLVENGEYDVFGANGIIGKYTSYNHEFPEILLTCRGATCGTINVSNPKSWVNGNAMVIHSKSDILLFNYLRYAMTSLDYSNIITGAAQPQITRQSLSPTNIPVPPMQVQEQIVAELDKINEVIEDCRELLRNLDVLAQSLFYDYFGDPVTNPKGWDIKKFHEVFKLSSGDGLSAKQIMQGKYPVYGGNGIVGHHYTYNIKGQNIIIGRVGALCGNVRLVIGNAFITDNAFITFLNENLNLLFISHLLTIINLHQYAKAVAQPVISNASLKNIMIILPPLSLQDKFAARIEQIEAQKKAVEQTIAELQTLLDSRMDYWFN